MEDGMNTLIGYIHESSWFRLDGTPPDAPQLIFHSRQHGNAEKGTAGIEDLREATRLYYALRFRYAELDVEVREVDEWVHLMVTRKG